MHKITLSRAHPPRLLLGWERRVYPHDVALRKGRFCDPRILQAWDALVAHPRIVSDYYGPIDYWRDRHLAKALLREPRLLAMLPGDPAGFAVAVALRFGFLRFRGAYRASLCCACAWPIKSIQHQKHCPRETKDRKRFRKLKANRAFRVGPPMPGAHHALLTEALVADWRPGKALRANSVEYFFSRHGLSDFYHIVRAKVGPFQADRLWLGLHLKRRLLPHLPGPTSLAEKMSLLRSVAPEVFRRLAVAPIRDH